MNYGKNATMLRLRKYDSKGTKLFNKIKIIVLKVFLVIVIVAGAAGINLQLYEYAAEYGCWKNR